MRGTQCLNTASYRRSRAVNVRAVWKKIASALPVKKHWSEIIILSRIIGNYKARTTLQTNTVLYIQSLEKTFANKTRRVVAFASPTPMYQSTKQYANICLGKYE